MEGIIGNDQSPWNAREWKDREMVGTWKESAIERRIEQSRETDRTSTPLRVECLPVSVRHLETFIKLQLADLIAALAVFVESFSLPWKVGYFIAFLNWQARFWASGVESRRGKIGVVIIA